MKQYLKNQIKKVILSHTVKLTTTDNSIIFKLENTGLLGKKYLLIKHRETGKRISKPVQNSKVELYDYELKNMGELGKFDIYLKIKLGIFEFISRTSFEKENKNKCLLNKKEKTIFRPYETSSSNLSFNLERTLFSHEITSLRSDQDQLQIEGILNLFEEVPFDSVEIAAKSDNFEEIKKFNCSYKKENKQILFKVKIELEITEKYLNTKWNLCVRLKNNGIILCNELLRCNDLKKSNTYENYSLKSTLEVVDTKISLDDDKYKNLDVVTYYFTTRNNYLRFRITTKDKWLETLKRAQNKTIFKKCCREEKIDNNLIFFESFHGQSYSNSPKYIYEKMLEMGYGDKYTFVWSYKGHLKIPGNPIIVNNLEPEYPKYLARAKYWVNNATFPFEDKQKKRVYIQTWHGTPLKRLGADVKVKNPQISWNHLYNESKNWNYLISANNYSSTIFKRAFKYNNKILEVGYPANDIFYLKNDELEKSLKKKFNFGDKKIILYAPTFRDNAIDKTGNRYFDLSLDLQRMYDKFKDEYVLILRTHSVVSNSLKIEDNIKDFVFDFSNYDDIHELFLISDILITDYSSVFFDFAHSKNPILFFVPDFKEYNIEIRGLYINMKKGLPGPLLMNNDELISAIENIKEIQKEFEGHYDLFYKKYCSIGHGDASEKVVNILRNR